jgi:uncharacterized RmlC-like cupin family protein
MSRRRNSTRKNGHTVVSHSDHGNDSHGARPPAGGLPPMSAMPTCRVFRPAERRATKQGLIPFAGLSAESVGARGICLHLQTIPPAGRAKAHLHSDHEIAIYVLSGAAEMWFGAGLRQHLVVRAGDFLCILAGIPHLPANLSQTEPCTAIIACTDPNE